MAKLSANYDCCIKITKPKEFIEVLAEDFKNNQRIRCGSISGKCFYKPIPAEYGSYDYTKISEIEAIPNERWRLYFIKPLQFSYQEEFRIVWFPTNTLGLQPVLTQSLTAASMCEVVYITDRT
jgi:hypothetical protein